MMTFRATVVLVAALSAALITARLGVWQLSRAAQKQALQVQLESRSVLPELPAQLLATTPALAHEQLNRRVRLQGTWMSSATVFLDNRQMDGQTGFLVLTPLRLDDGTAVVIQRGWAARDFLDRKQLPTLTLPAGQVELVGWVGSVPARLYDFGGEAPGLIRQNLDLAQFALELKTVLRPYTVRQAQGPELVADGLHRRWAAPAADVQKNYGYAFQWFALCALITGLYVWFQLIRPRLRA